jgi:hypothetical protein
VDIDGRMVEDFLFMQLVSPAAEILESITTKQ